MSKTPHKKKRGGKVALIVATGLALAIGAAVIWYASDYSHADATAIGALSGSTVTDGAYACGDPEADTALILYPGGKVEFTAYAPLAKRIADEAGILVIVPKMPLHLAVFDMDAARDIMPQYPNVTAWYVGGHSLGGAMAASFAASEPDAVAGVVLLAAYSTEPLTMPALSVYGSLDSVLDGDKYVEYRSNLPETTTESVLSGGNHAQFGSYGAQTGDTAAAIAPERQQELTALAVAAWLQEQIEDAA